MEIGDQKKLKKHLNSLFYNNEPGCFFMSNVKVGSVSTKKNV